MSLFDTPSSTGEFSSMSISPSLEKKPSFILMPFATASSPMHSIALCMTGLSMVVSFSLMDSNHLFLLSSSISLLDSILSLVMSYHICVALSRSPHAYSAAFSAPTELPDTAFISITSLYSSRAFHTPIS